MMYDDGPKTSGCKQSMPFRPSRTQKWFPPCMHFVAHLQSALAGGVRDQYKIPVHVKRFESHTICHPPTTPETCQTRRLQPHVGNKPDENAPHSKTHIWLLAQPSPVHRRIRGTGRGREGESEKANAQQLPWPRPPPHRQHLPISSRFLCPRCSSTPRQPRQHSSPKAPKVVSTKPHICGPIFPAPSNTGRRSRGVIRYWISA